MYLIHQLPHVLVILYFSNLFCTYVHTLPVADPGFSPGGAATPKIAIIFQMFAENCMKMKEFGPPGGRVPGAPLDPPMVTVIKEDGCFCLFN